MEYYTVCLNNLVSAAYYLLYNLIVKCRHTSCYFNTTYLCFAVMCVSLKNNAVNTYFHQLNQDEPLTLKASLEVVRGGTMRPLKTICSSHAVSC